MMRSIFILVKLICQHGVVLWILPSRPGILRDRAIQEDMLSAMVFLDPHQNYNAPLNIFPERINLDS